MSARFYVYVIFDLEGNPRYVGKGCGNRWLKHASDATNPALKAIYRTAGGGLPIVKVRENLSNEEAIQTEKALILAIERQFWGGPLFNLTDGGEGGEGYRHTPEMRAHFSTTRKGRKHTPEQTENIRVANTGKKRNADAIRNISASLKGRSVSEESKRKNREAHVGFRHTPEARAKIAQAGIGRKRSAESIEGTARALRGVPRPPEVREKLRQASLGRKQTEEAKAKLRAHFTGRKRVLTPEHVANIRAAVVRRVANRYAPSPGLE